ncbi:hypothetical protein [Zoogloea sp.]|uniref:hypothetical protein n=1 Tax=Zoogloea sp. TaxID=49181 RepID=UPI001A5F017D|nr:hypothetical protein [Zoogloeaceae bacterium]
MTTPLCHGYRYISLALAAAMFIILPQGWAQATEVNGASSRSFVPNRPTDTRTMEQSARKDRSSVAKTGAHRSSVSGESQSGNARGSSPPSGKDAGYFVTDATGQSQIP